MEMEYRDPSRRGKFIVILGVVLALAAGGAAFFLINQAQQQAGQSGLKTVSVVVAARPIPARKPVEADDLTVRQVPLDPTNSDAIIVKQPDQVIGRVLAVSVLQDQMITLNMLASTATGGQFSILEPGETIAPDSEAWRAVSLTVPDDRAVGGLLQPGMTVDVFTSATVNVPQDLLVAGQFYTDKSTKITYQNMVILARAGTFYVVKATLRNRRGDLASPGLGQRDVQSGDAARSRRPAGRRVDARRDDQPADLEVRTADPGELPAEQRAAPDRRSPHRHRRRRPRSHPAPPARPLQAPPPDPLTRLQDSPRRVLRLLLRR